MLFGAALVAATLYLGGLFWLAAWRDARSDRASGQRFAGWVYGLSLAVYCTGWTFFGGVGTAARGGWEYLPIYLGPILVFTLGYSLVRRILRQARAQHSTSIADFLSARYGKSGWVAAAVTTIAAIGSIPYMALQLQSVANSLLIMEPELTGTVALQELLLAVAAAMAAFAILFGSRRADRAGDNAGLVLTIAVESVVKLVALLAVAIFAVLSLSSAPAPPADAPAMFTLAQFDARFVVLTILAACAALCLPRQFHMAFVEANTDQPDRAMRWVFPAYLVLTALVIIPIALAGTAALPAGADPDTIVLALPLMKGDPLLALLVFIGGFSASVGMIIVASVALSIMITNDLIAPAFFREAMEEKQGRSGLARRLLLTRRVVIAVLLGLAYLFAAGFAGLADLAGLGTLAFAAMAQFAPGLVFGITSRNAHRVGMLAGLGVGFAAWVLLLAVPSATEATPFVSIHPDTLVSGVVLSLGLNCLAFWVGSLAVRPNLLDQAQAAAFVENKTSDVGEGLVTRMRVADLRLLLAQFQGKALANETLFGAFPEARDPDPANPAMLALAERSIAGVIGTSSARLLVGSWAQGEPVQMAEVVAMLDETSKRLSFSGDLLQIAIENIDQAVALVDADMRLVAWNERYETMFDLPASLASVGTPIAELIQYNLARNAVREAEIAAQVARRLDHMRAGRRHRVESEQADGRVLRIIGNPAPGGGYVTSYTDITEDRRAEQALEEKVAERTKQLSQANAALDEATRAKTRFLAAASHDLIQPLNAARLFASALGEDVQHDPALSKVVRDLDGSIASADRLIRALLDISKLDGGGIEPKNTSFALDEIVSEIAREFSVQAEAKGLTLKSVSTSARLSTDRALLTSVLRNLVSNAVRYTPNGTVLIGVRRSGDGARLCVYDTGPGIVEADRDRIFDEFQRATSGDHDGLGLGLAIVRRITDLLGYDLRLQTQPGHGTCFSVGIPDITWTATERPESPTPRQSAGLIGSQHVLVIDNDSAALTATSSLLKKWGLQVSAATGPEEALSELQAAPDAVVMDYRLDDGMLGDAAFDLLCEAWAVRPPAILLTAEDGPATAKAARVMGAHRLLKPASPAALRALLVDAVSRARRDADQPLEEASTAG